MGRQTLEGVELLIVDNGSKDGSVEFVRERFPKVRVISSDTNLGFAAGNNLAIRQACTDYVALLNNDAEADPRWIEELVNALDRHPEISFCASKMVLHKNPGLADSCGDSYSVDGTPGKIGHLDPAAKHSEPMEVFGACAGAAMYRRSMLEELGGFDEDFFLVYEDSDLSFRARLRGYKCLYVPTAVVRHYLGGTLGKNSSTAAYYAQRNMEYVFFKNMPTWLLFKYLPLHVLANAFRQLVFLTRGQASVFVRAKYDALRGMPMILRKRRRIQDGRRLSSLQVDALLTRRPLFKVLLRTLRSSPRGEPEVGGQP
jgi:GT2 family glycosyltransferase